MKYASIEKPLQIGAKVASFDATAALKVSRRAQSRSSAVEASR